MSKIRAVQIFLEDILESIKKINKYIHGISYNEFLQDEKTQDAVVRNLEIIGEAVKNIDNDFKEKHLGINWKLIIGMRNKLIHRYFGVSQLIVWETIKTDLSELKPKIEEILKEIKAKQ